MYFYKDNPLLYVILIVRFHRVGRIILKPNEEYKSSRNTLKQKEVPVITRQ